MRSVRQDDRLAAVFRLPGEGLGLGFRLGRSCARAFLAFGSAFLAATEAASTGGDAVVHVQVARVTVSVWERLQCRVNGGERFVGQVDVADLGDTPDGDDNPN